MQQCTHVTTCDSVHEHYDVSEEILQGTVKSLLQCKWYHCAVCSSTHINTCDSVHERYEVTDEFTQGLSKVFFNVSLAFHCALLLTHHTRGMFVLFCFFLWSVYKILICVFFFSSFGSDIWPYFRCAATSGISLPDFIILTQWLYGIYSHMCCECFVFGMGASVFAHVYVHACAGARECCRYASHLRVFCTAHSMRQCFPLIFNGAPWRTSPLFVSACKRISHL